MLKIKSIFLTLLSLIFFISCAKKESFEPPNKDSLVTGTAENISKIGTAQSLLFKAQKMAKVWSEDAVLTYLEGIDVSESGYTKDSLNSKWLYVFFSQSKIDSNDLKGNSYTITFSGNGHTTWLHSNDSSNSAKKNISNFAIDSFKAMNLAKENNLNSGDLYTMALNKDDKGIKWYVSSRRKGSTKPDIKKIDAISGNIIN